MTVSIDMYGTDPDRRQAIVDWYNEHAAQYPNTVYRTVFSCSATTLVERWADGELNKLSQYAIGYVPEIALDSATGRMDFTPQLCSESELHDRRLLRDGLMKVSIMMDPRDNAAYPILGFVFEPKHSGVAQ